MRVAKATMIHIKIPTYYYRLPYKSNKNMRPRGIEPLAKPWKGFMLPLHHERLVEFFFYLKLYRL